MDDVASPAPRASVPPRTLPVLSMSIQLHTEFAQRVYKRCFDRLKGDLYVLTVRTRAGGMDEAAKAIETILTEEFAHVRRDLESELERSDALLDDAKLTGFAEYEGVPTIRATYSTPRAREFLDLLIRMDQLLMRYDALWLSSYIETSQRWTRCQNWQRRLTKVANRLRELGNKTRAGLTREAEKRAQRAPVAGAPEVQSTASPQATETVAADADDLDADTSPVPDDVPDEFRDPADLAAASDAVSPDTVAESAETAVPQPAADASTPARPRRRRATEAATG